VEPATGAYPEKGARQLALRLVLVALLGYPSGLACALAQASQASPEQLADFAGRVGLHQVEPFVDTVISLRSTGGLPERYVTKEAARDHDWHGGGLCMLWPGHVIGGDRFGNFGGQLPAGHRYFEADLDNTCRRRGPRRLIYSSDGLIFVTTDHYRSFVPVP
jgi:ribonuclease T1